MSDNIWFQTSGRAHFNPRRGIAEITRNDFIDKGGDNETWFEFIDSDHFNEPFVRSILEQHYAGVEKWTLIACQYQIEKDAYVIMAHSPEFPTCEIGAAIESLPRITDPLAASR